MPACYYTAFYTCATLSVQSHAFASHCHLRMLPLYCAPPLHAHGTVLPYLAVSRAAPAAGSPSAPDGTRQPFAPLYLYLYFCTRHARALLLPYAALPHALSVYHFYIAFYTFYIYLFYILFEKGENTPTVASCSTTASPHHWLSALHFLCPFELDMPVG